MNQPAADGDSQRLAMLRSLGLERGLTDPSLNALAALAAEIAGVQIAMVCLLEAEELWVAGAFGFPEAPINRRDSFSRHVLAQPEKILWIEDARRDPRVFDNRYVTGSPHVRFYAGAPLVVNDCAVGSLCVFGTSPRGFNPATARALQSVAQACSAELAERHRTQAMREALTASADALVDCDEEGLILAWSDGAEQLFGYPRAEALGSEITLIIPPDFRDAHRKGMGRWRASGAARLGRRLELPAIRRDGSDLDIELWMSVSHEAGRARIHANIRDISQRRLQERELEAAKARAEAASEAKTAFLATVSHELRTPLNGVTAAAGLLAASSPNEEQSRLIEIVSGAADQLGRLIGDILDVARTDAGDLRLDPAPVDLGTLVEDIVALSRLQADEKGLEIGLTVTPDARGAVMADGARLRQVLGNLLGNAIKFTDRGRVDLRVERAGDTVRITVTDTGVGFGPDVREVIFDRFAQADSSITRRFGGAGLGLAICRDLVEAMGGAIGCLSTPGEGATFRVELPLPEIKPVCEPAEAPVSPGLDGLRILVVDDNATNRQVAGLILQAAGVAVAFACDGQEALGLVAADRFDLILMDMMMPVMDGVEAIRRLRAGEAGPDGATTPVIMLTANTLPEHVAQALAAGADRHLAKPVSPAGLLGAVAEVRTGYDDDLIHGRASLAQ